MAAPEQWWVILAAPAAHGAPGGYQVVQSASRPNPGHGSAVAAGPFPSKADAQSWVNNKTKISLPFNIPNPFSWVGGIEHWVGLAVASVTDVHLWISLGWLGLGALLLFWGIILWLKVPQRAAQTAVSVAPAAA
jgi:hypothetical protein